jgi:hypothetical protein
MDEFEKRLKQDADAISATVSPELRARIDASLHGIEPIRLAKPRSPAIRLWWASSLTGLAAAVLAIVLINWNQPAPESTPAGAVASLPPPTATEPPLAAASPLPLDIRTADFASPLQEELARLQSDIERARESVREDLDFTF